jgi:hypothetical protein
MCALALAREDGRPERQLRASTIDCAAMFAAAKAKGEPPLPMELQSRLLRLVTAYHSSPPSVSNAA